MTRRHVIAVAIAVSAMLAALAQPLWIQLTGNEVTLELRPVDPLSFFRGNYVDLDYDLELAAPDDLEWGDPVFVVFDESRPSRPLRATATRPDLASGESCIRGRVGSNQSVRFPSLEQFFVTSEKGRQLENDLDNMVGVVRATDSCRAILTNVERE